MASVTMQCPQCGARKVIVEGEPYNQKDLVCAVDGKDLVIATTSSEPAPEPALFDEPAAEAAPAAETDAAPATEEADPDPLTPEEMAKRLEKIMALEKGVRDAEIVYDRKHKQAKTAKEMVTAAQEALVAYIRECRLPKILPLFDGAAAAEAPAQVVSLADQAMQDIIDAEQSRTEALKTDEQLTQDDTATKDGDDEPTDDAPEAGF